MYVVENNIMFYFPVIVRLNTVQLCYTLFCNLINDKSLNISFVKKNIYILYHFFTFFSTANLLALSKINFSVYKNLLHL